MYFYCRIPPHRKQWGSLRHFALFLLLGQRQRALAQMHEHRQQFDVAFEKAANNITEPGEPELLEAIRRDRQTYYQRFDTFLADTGRAAEGRQAPGIQADTASDHSTYFTVLELLATFRAALGGAFYCANLPQRIWWEESKDCGGRGYPPETSGSCTVRYNRRRSLGGPGAGCRPPACGRTRHDVERFVCAPSPR